MAISQSWLLSTSGSVVAETSSLDYTTSGYINQDQLSVSKTGALNLFVSQKYATQKDLTVDQNLKAFEDNVYPALHFDPTAADDSGDGSIGRPYKNLTAARLKHGYRHLIKAGTTITTGAGDPWLSIPNSATDKSPIIIGRYGDAHAANPIINGAASTKVIRGSSGAKNWRLRDLEIIGPQAGSTRYAISQQSVDATADQNISYNIIISNCKIHNVTTDSANDCNGIKLYGADNKILNCEIYDIATDAVWFHGFRTLVAGCKIYRVAQDGRNAGDCIQCGAKSDGSIVRGNWLDHFEVDIKQCIYFEQTVSVSDKVLIEDNYCVSADGTAGAAGPITCGATNSVIRRNFCKGGYVGIIVGQNSLAHHNVVVSTVGRGIDCKVGARIFNNTIVQTGNDTTQAWSVGIRGQSGDTGIVAANNVLIGQYNGILCAADNGIPNIVEYNNAFAIRGVSDAKYRVDGVVTATTNAVTVSHSTYLTGFNMDVNYKPSKPTILDSGTVVTLSDFYDKEYDDTESLTIGAFKS